MKKLIYILLIASIVSCGKNPEEDYQRALKNFKESDTTAAELFEAAVLRRGGRIFDTDAVRSGGSFLYELQGSKVTLYYSEGSRTCRLPEGVAFRGAAPREEICYVAAGRYLLVYSDGSSFERAIKFADGAEVFGVTRLESGVLVLAGRKLYLLRGPGDEPELLFQKEFSTPVKKLYQGYLATSGDMSALVLGYAGRYHITLVNTSKQVIVADKISAAGNTCYLDGSEVFYVSGGSGSWKITRYNGNTKNKKGYGTFTSITNIALFKDGFAIENLKGVELFDFKGTGVSVPVKAMLQGGSGDSVVLTFEDEKTAVIPFDAFRKDMLQLRKELPALFSSSSGK